MITTGGAGTVTPGEIASHPVVFAGGAGRMVAIYNPEPLALELPTTMGGQATR